MVKRTGRGNARDVFQEPSKGVGAMRDDREGRLDLRRQWVEPAKMYQLKVTLLETDPPIWRRLRVPGSTSLARLDRIIQIAMGWTNSHLHSFTAGGVTYADPSPEWEIRVRNERRTRLEGIAKEEGEAFIYEYDLGDSWRHQVLVEEVRVGSEATLDAACLGGERACPPEDSGSSGASRNRRPLKAPGTRTSAPSRSAVKASIRRPSCFVASGHGAESCSHR